jgi:hypothetical protein
MDEPWRLKVGDRVVVTWAHDACLVRGILRYMPQASGDSWIIELEDGAPFYVQQFETISRVQP